MKTLSDEVTKSAQVISDGGIILYPTDTVWGIGCLATDDDAIKKIYELKRRDDSKAMIILVDSYDMACRYVKQMPEMAADLWSVTDTPLTLVLPGGTDVSSLILPEEGTIAIRVTRHEFCRRLISRVHTPIVSTSANISGEPSAARFVDISQRILDGVDYVVDNSMEKGSTCKPSSVISLDLSNVVKILRK